MVQDYAYASFEEMNAAGKQLTKFCKGGVALNCRVKAAFFFQLQAAAPREL